MKTRPHHPTGISRVSGPRPASSHLGTEQPWEGRQCHSHFPGEKQAQKGQGARSGSHGWCVGRQAPKSPLLTNPAGRLRPPPSFLGRSPSHPWDCLPSKCPTCLWLETLELGERKHWKWENKTNKKKPPPLVHGVNLQVSFGGLTQVEEEGGVGGAIDFKTVTFS